MRVADQPLPPVTLDPIEGTYTSWWPIRPVVAITQDVPYSWDDGASVWDAEPDPLLWDVDTITPDWLDATCDLIGLETSIGNPDDRMQFDAGSAIFQLRNDHGQWSQYRADGSPAAHGPGDQVAVWATDGSSSWWMFSGRITRWDEFADGTVEIEAVDSFSDLAISIGTFTPGTAAQHTPDRMLAILNAAQLAAIPHSFGPGVVGLTAQATDQSPLEEMQVVMLSDGGLVFVDSDGTLVSYDRTWKSGRADQPAIPVFSHNVCATPIVVWNTVLSTNDEGLADTVILQNLAGLRATAALSGTRGRFVLTETELQWTTQTEGDILAQFVMNEQKSARVRVESFDLYLLDPGQPDLWRAVDWRLFDRLRFIHDVNTADGLTRLDLSVLVLSIQHNVTASNWIMTVGCSRAFAYTAPLVWDTTAYVWNDASPLAVWSY